MDIDPDPSHLIRNPPNPLDSETDSPSPLAAPAPGSGASSVAAGPPRGQRSRGRLQGRVDCPIPECTANKSFSRSGIGTHMSTKHKEVAHLFPRAADLPESTRNDQPALIEAHASQPPPQMPSQPVDGASGLPAAPMNDKWGWAETLAPATAYHLHFSRPRMYRRIPKNLRGEAALALRVALQRVIDFPFDPAGWVVFFMFPLWCLRQIKDTGSKSQLAETRRQFHDYASGKWEQLHRELEAQLFSASVRPAPAQPETEDPGGAPEDKTQAFEDWCIRKAIKLGRERELSRAARALHPSEPAPANLDTVQALLSLHPPATDDLPPWLQDFQPTTPFVLSEEVLKRSLHNAPRLSAGGPSGWTYEFLRDLCPCDDEAGLFPLLFTVCSRIAQGQAPPFAYRTLTMARLLAIQKPDSSGIRPVAIGETLARLVGRAMVVQLRDALQQALMPLQFGIAVQGGTEAVVLGIRAALQAHPDWVVLKVDVSNAFNSVHRSSFFEALLAGGEEFRSILPFVRSMYGAPSDLWFRLEGPGGPSVRKLSSTTGTRQGDPLGGPLFALAHHGALQATQDEHPGVFLPSIADDTYILGTRQEVGRAFLCFQEQLARRGLRVNRAKCALLEPPDLPVGHTSPLQREAFEGVHITSRGIKVLGCPLGDSAFATEFLHGYLQRKGLGLQLVQRMPDGQVAHQLLTRCFAARPQYLLRCTPLLSPGMVDLCRDFSASLTDAMALILGYSPGAMEAPALRQLQLPIALGGLGLVPLPDIAPTAFLGAWAQSAHLIQAMFGRCPVVSDFLHHVETYPGSLANHLRTCHRSCEAALPDLPSFQAMAAASTSNIQAAWSTKMETAKADALMGEATTAHDRARLLCVRQPMAGLWLADGVLSWDAIFPHEAFLTAVRLRLGLPHPGMQNIPRCTCGADVDPLGLHHLHCKTDAELIIAHNSVRDSIGRLCRSAGYTVKWEQAHQIPFARRSTDRSRGPVTDLVLFKDGIKTLLDVTIRDPCCPSMVSRCQAEARFAAKKGEAEKIRKYASRPPQVHFVPAAFESLGAWGEQFSRFFSAVARRSRDVHLQSTGNDNIIRRMKSKVSSALAKAIASHLNAKFEAVCLAAAPHSRHGRVEEAVDNLMESLLAA